jgi:hypothetical protein
MLSQQQTLTSPPLSTLNLATLPLQLQIELIDFYEFLLQKYKFTPETKVIEEKSKFKNFLANPIQVSELQTWTRDELHER